MIRAEALQIRTLWDRRYQPILWVPIALAAYILAYSSGDNQCDHRLRKLAPELGASHSGADRRLL